MAYTVRTTNHFDKNLARMRKRGLPMDAFKEVVRLLMANGKLPARYKSHKLKGRYAGKWECHITPDWLLVWEQYDAELVLLLIDTGSHSDLF
ncbi:MAG: type II toxin-antitoxin system YafQ family toxin [Bacteroidales bacterium]|nr:type II toxin-antitoxin system YafQ family toxin [Bacteroidales bacterium]